MITCRYLPCIMFLVSAHTSVLASEEGLPCATRETIPSAAADRQGVRHRPMEEKL